MEVNRKKIIIVPLGGLANRMRAIMAAWTLSQTLGRELTVSWKENEELNAPFSALFSTDDLPFSVWEPTATFPLLYEFPRKKNLYISKMVNLLMGNRLWHIDKEISQEVLLRDAEGAKNDIIIHSGSAFFDYNSDLLPEVFRFSEAVILAKERILNGRIPDYALQIRRSDNKDSIVNSPLELFEGVVKDKLAEKPTALFFLATDSDEVKENLCGKYGANILINQTSARRDSVEGMIDAAAEMKIMSECSIIYGSYWSSFSEIASAYGRKPLKVMRKMAE